MQHDYAFSELEKQHSEEWTAEDTELDAKLEALRKEHGKRPNIVYLLADDVGWGDPGCYGGGKVRGAPTPNLDRMAREGMKFLSFYSEPSCTPSRVALMTGRYPVRTGVLEVLWPGSTQGLEPEETTIATLLSGAGYSTGFFGKWHMGEEERHMPQNHGFDETYFTIYNAAPFAWGDPSNKGAFDWPFDAEAFEEKYPIRGILEAKRNETAKEVEKLSLERLGTYEQTLTEKTIDFISRHADDDEPFFVYTGMSRLDYFKAHPDWEGKSAVRTNQGDLMMEHDDNVGRILGSIQDLGIAENTLVVWMSDNGPMYQAYPDSSFSYLRGGKGEVTEGGVRVPAIAWWPGTIEPNQDPNDIISITDWFTTAAHLGGADADIPDDRIIDGVDQRALIIYGEDKSRRDYLFHYSGAELGAVRKRNIKRHIGEPHGGLPGGATYDLYKDPREERSEMIRYMSYAVPFQDMVQGHKAMIQKFPNRELTPSAGGELSVAVGGD